MAAAAGAPETGAEAIGPSLPLSPNRNPVWGFLGFSRILGKMRFLGL